jgi:hypothetical protein
MPGRFKISQLAFKSQSNQFGPLEAATIKRFVVVATPHANSIAAIIESDDRYAHELYVNSSNAIPWRNGRFPDAKTVLSKRGFTR